MKEPINMVVEVEVGHDVLRLRVHSYYRDGLLIVKKRPGGLSIHSDNLAILFSHLTYVGTKQAKSLYNLSCGIAACTRPSLLTPTCQSG